jgi:hypothetical protein
MPLDWGLVQWRSIHLDLAVYMYANYGLNGLLLALMFEWAWVYSSMEHMD